MPDTRLCLDTSSLVVGVARPVGLSGRILRALIAQRLTVVTSPEIEEEWVTAFMRQSVRLLLERAQVTPQAYLNAVADVRLRCLLVMPTGEPPPCRDERDRMYLHCALQGDAEFVVTLDNDLLAAPQLEGVRIVRPRELAASLATRGILI